MELQLGRALPPVAPGDEPVGVHEVLDPRKPDSVYLVQSTLEQVVPRADEFARIFYDRLFDRHPEVRPLFDHVDMNIQRSMLMNMLAVTVRGLDRLDELLPTLQDLGRRHAGYGARVHHYRGVGQALRWALQVFFGESFTPEVEVAWMEVYAIVARNMIEGQRRAEAG